MEHIRLDVTLQAFELYDEKGNEIYFEDIKGYWSKREYDEKGNDLL